MRAQPGGDSARRLMLNTYRQLPAAAGPALRHLADALLADNGGVLVHCTAGKDRTGFVIAAMLSTLGVPHEAVLDDYLMSARCGSPTVVAATRAMMAAGLGREPDDAAVEALTSVSPDYLATAFAVVD